MVWLLIYRLVRQLYDLTVLEVEHWSLVVDLRETILNDLLSKVDIKFVTSIPTDLSGNDFDDWSWVLFLLNNNVGQY